MRKYECNVGWEKLYQPIVDEINEHDNNVQNEEDKIGIFQIKEKWGGLRIYVKNKKNLSDELRNKIHEAEIESMKTCEFCGTKENVGMTMNNWITTCCEKCWREKILSNKYLKFSTWRNNETNEKINSTDLK